MTELDSVRRAAGSPGGGLDSAADRTWQASNRLLSDWISDKRRRLTEAILVARSIRGRLTAVFPLMADLCRNTCPWCPEPCCIVTRVWFDFRDVLLFHLTATPIPPGPMRRDKREACRYLTPRGCALVRLQRPWACTQYICATQRRCLVKTAGSRALATLESEIQGIAAARIVMEELAAKAVD
jgi:hypothetical protein